LLQVERRGNLEENIFIVLTYVSKETNKGTVWGGTRDFESQVEMRGNIKRRDQRGIRRTLLKKGTF